MGIAQKASMSMKSLGEPSIIKAMPDEIRQFEIGSIIGEATDLIERTILKTGEPTIGLKGRFRAIPTSIPNVADRETIESGVLWLPDFGHDPIAKLLIDNKESQHPDKNFKVIIGIDVIVVRANNPQGYSWLIRPALEGKSPLDEIQAQFQKLKLEQSKKVAQISKPGKDKSAA